MRANKGGRPARGEPERLPRVSEATIAYYDRVAQAFWDGTRDHDVSQNYEAFLGAIEGVPPTPVLPPSLSSSHAVSIEVTNSIIATVSLKGFCPAYPTSISGWNRD